MEFIIPANRQVLEVTSGGDVQAYYKDNFKDKAFTGARYCLEQTPIGPDLAITIAGEEEPFRILL